MTNDYAVTTKGSPSYPFLKRFSSKSYSTNSCRMVKASCPRHSSGSGVEEVQQTWYSPWTNSRRKALNEICHCTWSSSILLKCSTPLTGLLCGRCSWSWDFLVTLLILSALYIPAWKPQLNKSSWFQVNSRVKDRCVLALTLPPTIPVGGFAPSLNWLQ